MATGKYQAKQSIFLAPDMMNAHLFDKESTNSIMIMTSIAVFVVAHPISGKQAKIMASNFGFLFIKNIIKQASDVCIVNSSKQIYDGL